MDMEELTPRQRLERHIKQLEDAVYTIQSSLDDIERQVERLRELHPSLPGVMECELNGVKWFSDGWRCIRDAWPGEYSKREDKPDLGALYPQWEAVTEPVAVAEHAESTYQALAMLSDGTWVERHTLEDLTAGRGFTIHHAPGLGPVVYRDAAGQVAAVQMPVNESEVRYLSQRRPVGVAQ